MSRYQTINQPITVLGVYTNGQFVPKKFRWGQRVLHIDSITLTANTTDGGTKQRLVSVVSGSEVYRLRFDREQEKWWLEEIWVE